MSSKQSSFMPALVCLPVISGLVNEVEFLGLIPPKVVRTNVIVIARPVLITTSSTSFTTVNFLSLVEYLYLFWTGLA